jgi:hypothetical protein
MTGTVDHVKLLTGPRAGEVAYAVLRSDDGRRFFVPPTEAPAGLARGDRVTFDPDAHADPRGPVARRVKIVARAASTSTETRLPDAMIRCASCGTPFTWSSAEQAFYRGRNFDPPKRCKPCRRARTGTQRETA